MWPPTSHSPAFVVCTLPPTRVMDRSAVAVSDMTMVSYSIGVYVTAVVVWLPDVRVARNHQPERNATRSSRIWSHNAADTVAFVTMLANGMTLVIGS